MEHLINTSMEIIDLIIQENLSSAKKLLHKKITEKLFEAVIPHPYYGKFKKAGRNLRSTNNKQARIEIVFDGIRNDYHVHVVGTDTGEMFIWVTQGDTRGQQEFRQFRTVKKAFQFLKDRFGIRLSSWSKISGVDMSKMSKFKRKQMK